MRLLFAFLASVLIIGAAVPSMADQLPPRPGQKDISAAPDRRLKLYNIHNEEKIEVTFWANGKYRKRGLRQLNYFLRDWRADEKTEMDPELLTLVYNIKRRLEEEYPHVKDAYIHVISGYRSQHTNDKMRRSGRGMARKSQHILGKAIDIHIPGVPVKRVRDIAKSFQAGGVGYYPAGQFVHVDTGRVRYW